MADPESKKAPRPSTRPHKPLIAAEKVTPEKDDIFDALDIVETTITQVKSSGPPPPPPSRAPSGPPPLPSTPPRSKPTAHLIPPPLAAPPLAAPPPPSEAPDSARANSARPEAAPERVATTPSGAVTESAPSSDSARPGELTQPTQPSKATKPAEPSEATKPAEPSKAAETLKPPALANPADAPAPPKPEKSEQARPELNQEKPAPVETEFERLKGEVAKLRQERPRFGGSLWPLVAVAALAATAGYLLGDSIQSRSRAEVRKVAMDRYYAAQGRPADEQKEILAFIQKELTKDDPELARWAKSQLPVIEERLLALAEREAALKVRVVELKGELDRQVTVNLELDAEKARLESQIAALHAVEKKLTRLKESNVLLLQAKAGIERLTRQLSDLEESPEAKQVAP